MSYFNNFPNIIYNGKPTKNITLRAKIMEPFRKDSTNFYPYTVKDNQTAEAIAFDYYDDPNYVWVIYLCNDIIDPYYDWHMSQYDFEKFLAEKYGSLYQSQSIISHYKKIPDYYYISRDNNTVILGSVYDPNVHGYNFTRVDEDYDIQINPESFTTLGLSLTEWEPVSMYDVELEKNETKRFIKLLDRRLVPSLERQLKALMNE